MTAVHYQKGGFPPDDRIDWVELIPLIGPASAMVARYDGMLAAVPNPDILLSTLTTQEAVLSSRIEGIQATLGDVLGFEAGQAPESSRQYEDIQEILNYRAAFRHAENMLQELPLCLRVIYEAHELLLSGVRGEGRSPGNLRRIANWIGPPGCTIEQATFIPISAERLPNAMGDWESYIHQETADQLIQLAVLHAEFEALHPFFDGNGRLGRMLIPLILWQKDLIGIPRLYISAYFENNRQDYYNHLLAVSRDDDWTGWCKFFLKAAHTQAEDNCLKAKSIFDLYESMKLRVTDVTRSKHAIRTLDWIFQYPIFNSSHFVSSSRIPARSAWRLLSALCDDDILEVFSTGNGRRGATYGCAEILNIVEGREVF